MSKRVAVHFYQTKGQYVGHGALSLDVAVCGAIRGDILDDGKTPMTKDPLSATCGNCKRTKQWKIAGWSSVHTSVQDEPAKPIWQFIIPIGGETNWQGAWQR